VSLFNDITCDNSNLCTVGIDHENFMRDKSIDLFFWMAVSIAIIEKADFISFVRKPVL